MLRGSMYPSIDEYSEFENVIKYDIDNWLGNLYFEARYLDRYIDGHREYNVELEFTSTILNMTAKAPREGQSEEKWEKYLDDLGKEEDSGSDADETGGSPGKRTRRRSLVPDGWRKQREKEHEEVEF